MSKEKALLLFGLAMFAFGVPGCSRILGERSVLLRYSPQVGKTYVYTANLFGYREPTVEMTAISREDGWYRVAFSGASFAEPYTVTMDISERHNSSHPGIFSLNFPDDPVALGDTWEGEVPWYFEHHYVLDETPITVPASYELVEIEVGDLGTFALIEQTVDENLVVDDMVFHLGQLGTRWDEEGSITDVYEGYDAYGKLMVGDVVVGINGRDATSQQERTLLAEEYIQHPKEGDLVSLTILRDGSELVIDVQKFIDELAMVRVENLKSVLLFQFDVHRGILLTVLADTSQDTVFSSLTGDAFPIVDNYGGFSKFGYLEGKTVYEESYSSGGGWSMIFGLDSSSLLEEWYGGSPGGFVMR
jgi:hypothetical protein